MGRRRSVVFTDGAPITSDCPGSGNRTRAEKRIRKGRGRRVSDQTGRRPGPRQDGGAARNDDTRGGM